ncbi:M61 family metallopeptidase [Pedobacter chitinilyticus]|uniref:M61 family peptidase n=1 Tax=Pedobacter chitinilyticus TaxID=2233776 RepID=A0A443YPA3_9SPHI|nr:PDZ domain-containing protein [Pedobacter chitinilyticus]RWU05588.1 M61 family peptidase [Pedobacter chitinilyticus]
MKKILGVALLLTLTMAAKSQVKIGFEVSFKEPQAHYAEVEMNMSGIAAKDYVDLKMPVWTPGSYLVREFGKNVESFTATVNGKPAKVQKVTKNTWRVFNAKAAALKVNYRVYAFEISVRTAFIDESHAFLSSAGIFMYPAGMIKNPSTVKIVPFGKWDKVSTGLEPVAGQKFTYHAADFDILFDSPIEVGNQDIFEFTASGVKHEVAMYGGGNYDKERLKVDMAKIVEQGTAIFGDNPNKHYTFIVHNYAQGGGGLEHLNSTVLGASRNAYGTEKGYKGFLSLVAHEYFHLWNVKRLRPVALGPFDYDNENYTTNLWTAEGFTSYYENKLLIRAGATNQATFLNDLIGGLGTVINTPGAKFQSASSSSFDAWIIGYRPNENSKNSSISYYSKGEVVGMLMDLEIANATKGAKSLDDVMKAMYEQGKVQKRGYTDAEFKAMVEKISGISFTNFWAKYIDGVDDIDFEKFLAYAGIDAKAEIASPNKPYTGATLTVTRSVNVGGVSRNSPAWFQGLNVNDEILALDGSSIGDEMRNIKLPNPGLTLESLPTIAKKQVGDVVEVTVKRDGMEKKISLTLKESPNVRIKASYNDNATAQQLAVRKRWMGI